MSLIASTNSSGSNRALESKLASGASSMEYMPLRRAGFPRDPNCAGNPFFRVFHWGKDVDLILVDERSCRSAEVADLCFNDLAPTLPPEIRTQLAQQGFPIPSVPPEDCLKADPTRTLLGRVQKRLFKAALLRSKAKGIELPSDTTSR